MVDICFVHSAIRFRVSCQLMWLGLGCVSREKTHLIPDVCGCQELRILVVAVSRIGDVCCLPAPARQPFSFNSLGLSYYEEACSRNVHASGTLKFRYEGIFKIIYLFFIYFFAFLLQKGLFLLKRKKATTFI